MAADVLQVDEWITETLRADATLQDLLAIDGRAPGYQLGVYCNMAPEKDVASRKPVMVPFVIVKRDSGSTQEQVSIGGARCIVRHIVSVVVWDIHTGTVTFSRTKAVADRVDVLLHNVSFTVADGQGWSMRMASDTIIDPQPDGRINCGILQAYNVTISE
jgi:hypothetical protein